MTINNALSNTITRTIGLASFGIALSMLPSLANAAPPLLESTFEKDAGDWEVTSPNGNITGKIGITHEAAHVKEGKGALQFDYSIKKGDISALTVRVPLGNIAKMNSLHFWVQADHATTLLLVFAVRDGGRYQVPVAVSANSWQEVAIAPSDLLLNEDAGSPADPNGKLDLSRIDNIGIVDVASFLVQEAAEASPISVVTGQRTLYVSNFAVSDAALPAAPATPGEVSLTSFARPQIDWLALGDVSVKKVTEKPLTGPAIKATYAQKKMKIFGLIKQLPKGALANAKQLNFAIATTRPTTMTVQLETSDGGKFKTQIEVPGNSERKDFDLKLADFTPADDSAVKNAALDLKKVTKLIIVDITGFINPQDQENTLWLNNVHTTSK